MNRRGETTEGRGERLYAAIPINDIMSGFGWAPLDWAMWCFTGKSAKGEMCLFVRLRTGQARRARARPPRQRGLAEQVPLEVVP